MTPKDMLKGYEHVDLLYPSKYLKAADLRGRDAVVTIKSLDPASELNMRGGKTEKKPVISFVESDKLFCLCKTNAKSIAKVYGSELENWLGKRITIYPTKVAFGGNTVDAVRIREVAPKASSKAATQSGEHDPVTGEVVSSQQ